MWRNMDWTLILHLQIFYFLGIFTPTPSTVNGMEGGLLFFFLSEIPVFIFPETFVKFEWLSTSSWVSLAFVCLACVSLACVLTTYVGLNFLFSISRDLNLDWLEVFFTAFEKIISEFRFSLRSFRIACGLGMRSFIWIWVISISLLNFDQFRAKAWWSASQW